MANREHQEEHGERSGMRPHEEFLELCAVATTGELSEEEQKRLREHLSSCADCRQALSEFEAVASIGVPLLAPALAPLADEAQPATQGTPAAAPARATSRVEVADPSSLAGRNGHRPGVTSWNYVWLSFAAAILLTFALGIYSYRVGQQHSVEVVRVTPGAGNPRADALQRQLSDAGHEREALQAQLAERDRALADLRRQFEQQSAVMAEMKSAEAAAQERSFQADDAEKQRLAQERAALSQKLDAAVASVQKTQAELDSIRQQRAQDQTRYAGLEGQIKDLNAQLRDREQTIDKQDELLAHDRDIRDLMGARDLYIAEVYDVERDGATRKPYGRVFYTKAKSLIFYAYDLDQQAGVRNASTFQAWGRRGPDKQAALSLGIFFEDNLAKKRWVLKFDDPKTLAQIDAVFVTVEPNGGSHKPSGKPLLFAYLKVDPNHP